MTPIITPFKCGEIDYSAFDHLVKWQADCGVSGLILNTLSGEGPTISDSERRSLISRAVNLYRGHGIVLVATGTYSTQTTIRRTEEAYELGADVALIVQPYYSRPTQKGIIHHFEQIAAATRLPVIIDNDPVHAGVVLKDETVTRLLELPNIVGVFEEATSDWPAGLSVTDRLGIALRTASDRREAQGLCRPSSCVMSPLANVVPDVVVRMQEAARTGQSFDLTDCLHRFAEVIDVLEGGHDPALLKRAVSCVRGISADVRLPLMAAPAEAAKAIGKVLRQLRGLTSDLDLSPLVQEARAARRVAVGAAVA